MEVDNRATIELKLTGASDEGVISGVANVMEITDLGGDVIRAGAFTKTLADHGGKFPVELDHGNGLSAEIGVGFFTIVGNELRLEKGELNLEAVDIRDNIYPRLKFRQKHGLPAGLSINYRIPKGKFKFLPDGRREITEIALRKVGVIDEPMNQMSFIDSVKGLEKSDDPDSNEIKAGRSISSANERLIRQMIEMMNAMITQVSDDIAGESARTQIDLAIKALSDLEPDSSTPDGKPPEDAEPSESFAHFMSRAREIFA